MSDGCFKAFLILESPNGYEQLQESIHLRPYSKPLSTSSLSLFNVYSPITWLVLDESTYSSSILEASSILSPKYVFLVTQ